MAVPVFIVDAFAAHPFSGNPAAVCMPPGPRDAGWMQRVAAELNLSETAFLHPEGDGYRLRWFTPVTEVDLCGHATLAAAHILYERILPAPAGSDPVLYPERPAHGRHRRFDDHARFPG